MASCDWLRIFVSSFTSLLVILLPLVLQLWCDWIRFELLSCCCWFVALAAAAAAGLLLCCCFAASLLLLLLLLPPLFSLFSLFSFLSSLFSLPLSLSRSLSCLFDPPLSKVNLLAYLSSTASRSSTHRGGFGILVVMVCLHEIIFAYQCFPLPVSFANRWITLKTSAVSCVRPWRFGVSRAACSGEAKELWTLLVVCIAELFLLFAQVKGVHMHAVLHDQGFKSWDLNLADST